VTIDIGTGDGRAVLDAAARDPGTLVLGLDASAAAMVEASRRAAGPVRKGGRPNARFIVAAAEAPPTALVGVAELVTVRFPWGSLLRGCVGLDDAVAAGIGALVAPGGTLELLLAPSPHDGLDGVPTEVDGLVAAAARTFQPYGFAVHAGRRATPDEVRASGSTWAKRLAAGRGGRDRNGATNGDAGRCATLVRLVRNAPR
jgi:16S rRNA (adenine(1408)-N(1))-methyltransferase